MSDRMRNLTKYDIQRVYDVPPWLVTNAPRPRFARLRWMFRRVWPRGVWGPRP